MLQLRKSNPYYGGSFNERTFTSKQKCNNQWQGSDTTHPFNFSCLLFWIFQCLLFVSYRVVQYCFHFPHHTILSVPFWSVIGIVFLIYGYLSSEGFSFWDLLFDKLYPNPIDRDLYPDVWLEYRDAKGFWIVKASEGFRNNVKASEL